MMPDNTISENLEGEGSENHSQVPSDCNDFNRPQKDGETNGDGNAQVLAGTEDTDSGSQGLAQEEMGKQQVAGIDKTEKTNIEVVNFLLETYPNAFKRVVLNRGEVIAAFSPHSAECLDPFSPVNQGYLSDDYLRRIKRSLEEGANQADEYVKNNRLYFCPSGVLVGPRKGESNNYKIDRWEDLLFSCTMYYKEGLMSYELRGPITKRLGMYFDLVNKLNPHYPRPDTSSPYSIDNIRSVDN